jgi:hypothetical protein
MNQIVPGTEEAAKHCLNLIKLRHYLSEVVGDLE